MWLVKQDLRCHLFGFLGMDVGRITYDEIQRRRRGSMFLKERKEIVLPQIDFASRGFAQSFEVGFSNRCGFAGYFECYASLHLGKGGSEGIGDTATTRADVEQALRSSALGVL